MQTDYDRLLLHFKYCACIALMLVIAIATDRWSAKPDFTTYLSNSATMTSLLLGVVAIFYSFISNDSMSRSLGSITTVSSDVQAARHEIGQFVATTKTTNEISERNTNLVQNSSANLTISLSKLELTLSEIANQNQTLNSLLGGLPTRIDQLESKVVDVAKALGEKPQQLQPAAIPDDIPPRAITRFLARSALSQNLLAYACVLASTENKQLGISLFCKAVGFDTPSVYHGYLSCMQAMQLCSRKSIEGQERTFSITAVHPELVIQTRSYYLKYLEDNFVNKPMERLVWITRLEAVEAMFAEQSA